MSDREKVVQQPLYKLDDKIKGEARSPNQYYLTYMLLKQPRQAFVCVKREPNMFVQTRSKRNTRKIAEKVNQSVGRGDLA